MMIPAIMVAMVMASGVVIAPLSGLRSTVGATAVSVEPIRAVYLPAGVAGSSRFVEALQLLDTTSVNALVIDLKDPDGRLAFRPISDGLRAMASHRLTIPDPRSLVAEIHARHGIAIARIPVFQDTTFAEAHPSEALTLPNGALWRDRLRGAWLDPASITTRRYAIALAREAAVLGFDEVNFDYIRFPSEGPRFNDIRYPYWNGRTPKAEIITSFARMCDGELRRHGVRISADLFGLVFWARGDLGIGQQLERLAPHFDVLAPMVYPSHYRRGFLGHEHPVRFPAEVVAATLQRGIERLRVLPVAQRPTVRPWLQDFDLGATYDMREVRDQINASARSGGIGWMLWNPRATYTTAALGERSMR